MITTTLGASTSPLPVETRYLLIPINNLTTFFSTKLNYSYSDNLELSSKSFKYPLFSSNNYIKPISAKFNIKTKICKYDNTLNNLISKQNENSNLNNNLDTNLYTNLKGGLENEVNINIISRNYSNDPKLINDIKLVNVVNNNGTAVCNSSSIEDSIEDFNVDHNFNYRLNENINIIKSSKIINLNKKSFTNDNLESFSINDSDVSQSLIKDNNLTELLEIRKLLNNKWLNSKLNSYPLMDTDINQSLIEDFIDIKIVDDLIFIINKPDCLIKPSILNNDLNIKQFLNINKIKNALYLNNTSLNLEHVFVSHKVYIDFLDLLFCELYFINSSININVSCFIYGFLFTPTLFILNGLGYIMTSIIFMTTFYLINNEFDILLKNNLNQTNYFYIKNILNKFSNIIFNILFLYIIFTNITNISIIANLVLLKGAFLYGNLLLKDLNKSNNKYYKQTSIINKNVFLNPYIYKNKYYIY
jgi:hypothetical protein